MINNSKAMRHGCSMWLQCGSSSHVQSHLKAVETSQILGAQKLLLGTSRCDAQWGSCTGRYHF